MTTTPEAIRKNRRAFVDRLKANTDKQGRGQLRSSDNTFCCLGVAVDVVEPDCWRKDAKGGYTAYAEGCYLPWEIADQYALLRSPETVNGGAAFADTLNDAERLPFPVIAKEFEKLFRADSYGIAE